jgi:acyl-coenzyme A synthetase/AMP-(fatty) acid ligase
MLQFAGARRDEDGYLWVTGRVDDMLNVSGHLLSTAEVESTLSAHPNVAEAAVVSQAHPIKGECLYCFVTPNEGVEFSKKLTDELTRKGKGLVNIFHIKYLKNYICRNLRKAYRYFDNFFTYITCKTEFIWCRRGTSGLL